ncbi:MAG TPA: hypothetical protein DDW27_04480 [Bacteroidales bacterium]|nr:hypothetical protein [Bacteroidales bacterium]
MVSATTFYVSPTGNNSNPGTITSPWATWGHAFNSTAVRPGDIVYFRGGVYQMTSDNLSYPYAPGCGYNVSRDGTSGNYISYFAYPGEKPVLDCGNITPSGRNSRAIWGNDMNYVHFKGLTVRNVRQTSADVNVYGWVIEGRNIIVEGCTVHNTGGRGFFSTGHEIHYLNCDSYNNNDSMSASLPGNDGVGFQNVDLNNVDGSIYYKNCRAWMNGDQGFSAVSVGYLEFDGCWSFNNGQMQGEGHGFKMGAVGIEPPPFGPLKRKYTNCVAAFNRANGWTTNDNQTFYTHLMHIYNNTSYHNGHPTSYAGVSYGFVIYNTASVDAEELARTYRNNISYQNQHGATFIGSGALYTHSNNSWDISGLTVTNSDFTSLDSTGITAARQADYTLPNNSCYNNFLRIAPGSKLIDAGVSVGLPFSGTSPDLGAFESSAAPSVPSAPVYVSSSIENATPARLEMTYNMTLANIVPAASAFTVRVNTVVRTVSAVAISGTKVLLTLASPVVYGDVVTVAYTKPSSNPLQTAAGGQAASFSAMNVVNNVAVVNQPPVVNISSPTKSTSFVTPATITIDATASDPDGIVAKVEFYQGTVKLGESTATPYSFTWKDVPAGTYSITAAATDNKQARTISSAVTITVEASPGTVNQEPLVIITTPSNNRNKKYKKNEEILIVAEASDPDGTISKVEFKSGEVTLAEVTSAPYTFLFEPSDTGKFLITAVATDNFGATSSSSGIELVIALFYDLNSEIIPSYPNPTSGQFTIDFPSGQAENWSSVMVVSLSGTVVYKGIIEDQEYSKIIDITDSAAGTYILMISNGRDIVATKKIIKK